MQARIPTAPNSLSPPQLQGEGICFATVYPYTNFTNSWLDGKHVVFGEVLEGYDVVQKIENVPRGPGDRPLKDVKIVKSGELPVPEEGIHVEL
jgi:cyclophilin family peptidyl-prolyl cis-trans isomerase